MSKLAIGALVLLCALTTHSQSPSQQGRAKTTQGIKESSSTYRANRLVQECRFLIADYDSNPSKTSTDGEHCLGYVQGFVETATMWQVVNEKSAEAKVPIFCLNPKATNEVIIRKIPIWAIEHPEDTKGSAIEFLISMLVENYPCQK